ncbi:hypothetical protein [Methylobacterium terrae]|uniref:hypothetical protein n=1 Tax=Methylobacterium terrae TaxID=2202827 RepID=UPI00142D5DAF|nr:hypothetical protein [Methylobacterium terrae]
MPTETLLKLKSVTLRGAALHKARLTPNTLRKKMDVRVSFGWYFELCEDGCNTRRVG